MNYRYFRYEKGAVEYAYIPYKLEIVLISNMKIQSILI